MGGVGSQIRVLCVVVLPQVLKFVLPKESNDVRVLFAEVAQFCRLLFRPEISLEDLGNFLFCTTCKILQFILV